LRWGESLEHGLAQGEVFHLEGIERGMLARVVDVDADEAAVGVEV
jgi:hypothetical protein